MTSKRLWKLVRFSFVSLFSSLLLFCDSLCSLFASVSFLSSFSPFPFPFLSLFSLFPSLFLSLLSLSVSITLFLSISISHFLCFLLSFSHAFSLSPLVIASRSFSFFLPLPHPQGKRLKSQKDINVHLSDRPLRNFNAERVKRKVPTAPQVPEKTFTAAEVAAAAARLGLLSSPSCFPSSSSSFFSSPPSSSSSSTPPYSPLSYLPSFSHLR